MSDVVFPNASRRYRPLRLRRKETLCRWLSEINKWRWPVEIAKLTGRKSPPSGDPFRSSVMDAILRELGYRDWLSRK